MSIQSCQAIISIIFPLFKNLLVLINCDIERNPEPQEFSWCVQAFFNQEDGRLGKTRRINRTYIILLGYVFQYTKKCYAGSQKIQSKFQKKGVSYIKIKIYCDLFLQNLTTYFCRIQNLRVSTKHFTNLKFYTIPKKLLLH